MPARCAGGPRPACGRRATSTPSWRSTPTASSTPPPPIAGLSRRWRTSVASWRRGRTWCAKGGTSFFTSGIDPGFANDLLPLVLSGLCGTWEEIRVQEIINYATYAQPEVLFDTMGFGQPLDAKPMLLIPGALGFGWGGTIKLLAEGLGLALDGIHETHERRPATRRLDIQGHVVEPGTMAALRFEVQGIVGGRPALVVEHVTRLDDDLAPEWPTGNGSYRVLVTGVPGMRCEYQFWDEHGDHAVGGVVLTATRLVNAISAVCDARAGLLSALDLPLVTGRGLYRAPRPESTEPRRHHGA
jgi:hypothetical protein